MKFVSKYSNYRITLIQGIPGNHLLGNPPKPALYIKFEDGVANVDNEEHIRMMKNHPAFFSGDFIEVSDNMDDPYKDGRKPVEPEHNISNMVHGSTVTVNPTKNVSFTPEQKKIMKEMIEEGIKSGLKIALENSNKDKTSEVSKNINEVNLEENLENNVLDIKETTKNNKDKK